MELATLPIEITASRGAGSGWHHTFRFRPQSLPSALDAIVAALPVGGEISIPDPGNSDCVLEARRAPSGLEIKRGCHGAAGTWRSANQAETIDWLARGTTSAEMHRSGGSLWIPGQ